MSKYIKIVAILALALAPTATFAQYCYGQDNSCQIAQIQAQLDALRAQLMSMGHSNSYQYQTYPYTYGSTGNVLGATYYGGYGSQYGQYGVNSCNFTVNLSLGTTHPQVADLNRLLGTGFGTYFDQATYNAVVNFQNMYAGEILAPAGLTYGNGNVGPLTRAKLNGICNGITNNSLTYGYTGYSGNVLGVSTYLPAQAGNPYVYNYGSTYLPTWQAGTYPYNYNSGYNYNYYTGVPNYYNNNQSGTPVINFYANPSNVYGGGSTTLYWTVNNANICTASSSASSGGTGWSGSKGTSGNEVVGNITNTHRYNLRSNRTT